MSSQATAQILVVDDHKSVSETIAMILRSKGYSVCTAANGRDALQRLKETTLQLVISDLSMPIISGFELISAIRWRFPKIPVIAMSGTYTADQIPRTVDAFYAKGKDSPDLLASMVEGLLLGRYKKESRSVRTAPRNGHRQAV